MQRRRVPCEDCAGTGLAREPDPELCQMDDVPMCPSCEGYGWNWEEDDEDSV